MPFIALDNNNNQCISYMLSPTEYRQDWKCPQCNSRLGFVDCVTRIKHFRHLVDYGCQWEPETKEHLALKKLVYDTLRYSFFVKYEVKVGNNIADIIAIGKYIKFAMECQVSPISLDKITTKNNEYIKEGFHPIWILHYGNFAKREEHKSNGYFKRGCDGMKEFHQYETPHQYYLYHPKLIEREYQDEEWLLYYFPSMGFAHIQFTPKWARGSDEVCKTICFGKIIRVSLSGYLRDIG